MLSWLAHFISSHSAVLGLLALAFIVTMREELPPPFNKVAALNWLYGWLHDGLKTFVSFRSPATPKKEG